MSIKIWFRNIGSKIYIYIYIDVKLHLVYTTFSLVKSIP